MTVSDMFKIRDYTKAKQRILFYIIFGLSALELLFSIIGLAAGKKGATRFFSKNKFTSDKKFLSNNNYLQLFIF